MLTHFPAPAQAPAKLLQIDGNCGLLVAWSVLKHFRRRTSTDRLVRTCRYTRRYGVFTIALATSLKEHGLGVTFHTDPDRDIKPLERRLYEKAHALQIPIGPAVSLRALLEHTAAGHIPIVFHDTPVGEGHFSPLLGERRGRLILPHSDGGGMSLSDFHKHWSAPEILRQCVIVTGSIKRKPRRV